MVNARIPADSREDTPASSPGAVTFTFRTGYPSSAFPDIYTLYSGKAKDSISVFVNAPPPAAENIGSLFIRIVNNKGISNSVLIFPAYVETNPILVPIYDANSKILDFNYGKLFIHNSFFTPPGWFNFGIENPRIVNIQTRQQTEIPLAIRTILINKVGLHSNGAIFNVEDSVHVSPYNHMYDWNNDSAYFFNNRTFSQVAGNFATHYSGSFMIRNLSSRSDTLISGGNVNVGENGTFAYVSGDEIYQNKNGVIDSVEPNIVNDNKNDKKTQEVIIINY